MPLSPSFKTSVTYSSKELEALEALNTISTSALLTLWEENDSVLLSSMLIDIFINRDPDAYWLWFQAYDAGKVTHCELRSFMMPNVY